LENVFQEDKLKTISLMKRYEQKYLLNRDQYENLIHSIGDAFQVDAYGPATIYSIYYDTPDHRIMRKTFTNSAFHEKLRLRSYGIPGPDDRIFVELKKKYQGVTYKRRFPVRYNVLKDLHELPAPPSNLGGLYDEFHYFYNRYTILPMFFISYDRIPLEYREDPNLRLTFDSNIRWRSEHFDFCHGAEGRPLIKEEERLMELKTNKTIPRYLSEKFSRLKIYPSSFSKSKNAFKCYMKDRGGA
jgi:SPX domain protein involved in polyphosphate accumulation